jgi:hypothetical protein
MVFQDVEGHQQISNDLLVSIRLWRTRSLFLNFSSAKNSARTILALSGFLAQKMNSKPASQNSIYLILSEEYDVNRIL